MPKLSVIITAKDENDKKLKDLLRSIELQSFKDYEVFVITEGNPESAKGIGVKKATGEFICIMASDNFLQDQHYFEKCLTPFLDNDVVASYGVYYYYDPLDNILNRYFSLFGFNDPIPFYLGKNDRFPHYIYRDREWKFVLMDMKEVKTFGDNGFFFRTDKLLQADIDHYFHIDVCQDLFDKGYRKYGLVNASVWHLTGGSPFKFFAKRFKYADQFSEGRRWKMVTKKDIPKLIFFVISTLTIVYPLYLSIRGYAFKRDIAWFLHLPVCFVTLVVYGILTFKLVFKRRKK